MDKKDRLDAPVFSDDQSMKNCKNAIPAEIMSRKNGHLFKKGDRIIIRDTKSLVFDYPVPGGVYYLDSYDKYDNTIYIDKTGKGHKCYNVTLHDIVSHCEDIDIVIKHHLKKGSFDDPFQMGEIYRDLIDILPIKSTDIRQGGCGFYYIFHYNDLNTIEESIDRATFEALSYKDESLFRVSSNGSTYGGFHIDFIAKNLK